MAIDDDILSPERVADPYPYFAAWREEDPVHWNEQYRAWFVHRFLDVWEGLRNPALSSDRVQPVFEHKLSPEQQHERRPTFEILEHWMVFHDPPDHTRLRRLVNQAFTPRSVQALRPRIEAVVADLLDQIGPRGSVDLIRDFAYPIPAVIIAEMMGVPPEDRDLFKAWSDAIMILVFGGARVEDRRERAQRSLLELADYLRGLIRRFRADPQDNLITSLVRAKEHDDALSEDEIVSTCTLLLFGGHETTTNLIGNGMLALLRHRGQYERLGRELGLAGRATEELLRYDPPVQVTARTATEDVDLRGVHLHKGEGVVCALAAANRDPAYVDRPEQLVIDRGEPTHLSFSNGIHHCLGAPLARLEGQVVFAILAHRFPSLELVSTSPGYRDHFVLRGLTELTLATGPG